MATIRRSGSTALPTDVTYSAMDSPDQIYRLGEHVYDYANKFPLTYPRAHLQRRASKAPGLLLFDCLITPSIGYVELMPSPDPR